MPVLMAGLSPDTNVLVEWVVLVRLAYASFNFGLDLSFRRRGNILYWLEEVREGEDEFTHLLDLNPLQHRNTDDRADTGARERLRFTTWVWILGLTLRGTSIPKVKVGAGGLKIRPIAPCSRPRRGTTSEIS